MNDTIFALASAHGKSGVNILRISGPRAREVFPLFCTPAEEPQPRMATLCKIVNPSTKDVIDHTLVLFFEGPNSFTGEDVVEFHLHGGRAILNAVVELLRERAHFRIADPGEFTRRAFENGKMDLTEAEAVADLVSSETEAQRKQAMRQFEGALGTLYNGWADRLKRCLAHSEAAIDFSDEELPDDIDAQQVAHITVLYDEIKSHLNDHKRGEKVREGFVVAILGAPNAGKSSLLNLLSSREAAIVSPIAGTTRDVIEVSLDMGGYPVTLLDTAGLRESEDSIESEGVRRALHRAESADIKLLLFDGSLWPEMDPATKSLIDADALIAVSKSDLLAENTGNADFFSVKTGRGVSELTSHLVGEIDRRYTATSTVPLTRARHRAALEECLVYLKGSLRAQEAALRAEEIRLAMTALGKITGRVDVEDLLDIIFRDFCIGK